MLLWPLAWLFKKKYNSMFVCQTLVTYLTLLYLVSVPIAQCAIALKYFYSTLWISPTRPDIVVSQTCTIPLYCNDYIVYIVILINSPVTPPFRRHDPQCVLPSFCINDPSQFCHLSWNYYYCLLKQRVPRKVLQLDFRIETSIHGSRFRPDVFGYTLFDHDFSIATTTCLALQTMATVVWCHQGNYHPL